MHIQPWTGLPYVSFNVHLVNNQVQQMG
uniref:Uncharacterized protein n=1 Tax=Arundo donax TaxID=35708 RepID=A0A0A9EUW0_ARUDO